ncbi:hypothetical protein OSB04_un001882 [Centaurea solstitialis]|uniref:GAG-pre-integrase domain-containing protein n=1 Tax=Centaurea solstitialis TaxID=347529 RepID=A0AA38SL34_9ASTR|nr:hypothetical protein OSB04_un001882 [Centaurea solstitialis]
MGLLFQSIPDDLILQIGNLETAKEMWDAIKSRNVGADRVKKARLQTLTSEFESSKMKETGTIDEFSSKLPGIATVSASLGGTISQEKLVKKLLTSLPRRFVHIVAALEQVLDLKTITYEDVVGRLQAYEERTKETDKASEPGEKMLYSKIENSNRNQDSSRGRGRANLNDAQERVIHEERAFFMMKEETVFLNKEKYIPPKVEPNQDEVDVWYLDNGASNHMTGNYSYFSELNKRITGRVKFGDGSCVRIEGKGSILFVGKNGEQKLLKDVYYIPLLRSNVISLGQTTLLGCDIRLHGDFLTMKDIYGRLLIKVPRSENRLYKIQLKVGKPHCLQGEIDDESWLWHTRLGHINFGAVNMMHKLANGVPVLKHKDQVCEVCVIGKQHKHTFPKKTDYKSTNILEVLHGDICGPIDPPTPAGVTPYEKFYGQKPNLEGLKVFGCVAYERIVSKHLKKLDDRSRPLVYFGKEPGSGGVRLFNPKENKIIISCNVSYNEKIAWNWDREEKELHEGRGSKKSESGTFVIPWLVTNGHVPPNLLFQIQVLINMQQLENELRSHMSLILG